MSARLYYGPLFKVTLLSSVGTQNESEKKERKKKMICPLDQYFCNHSAEPRGVMPNCERSGSVPQNHNSLFSLFGS